MPRRNVIIDSYDLTFARDSASEFLPDTCDIYAASGGKDSSYGQSRGTTLRASGVACRLTVGIPAPNGPRESVLAIDQRGVYVVYTLTLPYDQPIEPTDTVSHGGRTYEVVGPDANETTRSVRRLTVRRRV